MREGVEFPPVQLLWDGRGYWLFDGHHTTEAAWSIGKQDIEAEITRGTQRDAILKSTGANSSQGLRRTNADKRKAVMTLLSDPIWGEWSDREIARKCKVDRKTVGKIRKNLTGEISSDNLKKYKDNYENTTQMNTTSIGIDKKKFNVTAAPCAKSKVRNDDSSASNRANLHKMTQSDLAKQFEVGQLVKLQLQNMKGASDELKLANHSYGQITALSPSKL